MSTLYLIALLALLVAMAMTIAYLRLGPSIFDRLLAVNALTTKVVLLICIYCYSTGYPEYIDIALLYALINYVGTLAVVRYFRSVNTAKERRDV